jgi:DNA-nicking Smr family endonuclease
MSGSGGRKGRRLSKDEHSLWEGVTRSIAPLPKRAAMALQSDDDAPEDKKPASRKSRPAVTVAPPPRPKAAPKPVSLDRRLKQKISRGSQTIDARLDLHGFTQAEAHDALLRFLRASQSKGATVVLVITGKGVRGEGERGVLKRMVPLWLNLPGFRDYVVGFGDAGIGHGGEGALYVRLRKLRE